MGLRGLSDIYGPFPPAPAMIVNAVRADRYSCGQSPFPLMRERDNEIIFMIIQKSNKSQVSVTRFTENRRTIGRLFHDRMPFVF